MPFANNSNGEIVKKRIVQFRHVQVMSELEEKSDEQLQSGTCLAQLYHCFRILGSGAAA
jgi:hypothetical protein